jgi:hypothetical protein
MQNAKTFALKESNDDGETLIEVKVAQKAFDARYIKAAVNWLEDTQFAILIEAIKRERAAKKEKEK